jgi:cellobiose phosphorylase
LSGTASWAYYSATQWLLGVRPEVEGLRIDPCLPKAWKGFKMRRTFRGLHLAIEVRNPKRKCRGLKSLTVDGVAITGNLVPTEKLRDGSVIVAVLG